MQVNIITSMCMFFKKIILKCIHFKQKLQFFEEILFQEVGVKFYCTELKCDNL